MQELLQYVIIAVAGGYRVQCCRRFWGKQLQTKSRAILLGIGGAYRGYAVYYVIFAIKRSAMAEMSFKGTQGRRHMVRYRVKYFPFFL